MESILLTFFVLLFVLVSYLFLIFRLAFFKDKSNGRYPFVFGGALIIFGLTWQLVKNTTAYADWFLEGAYPVLDIFQTAMFLIGIILTAVGTALYADFWQSKKEAIDSREKQLSIIDDLSKISRKPYHITELMELSLKEIVSRMDETFGALFLVNRSRRQLVLTATVGLTKDERARLERYPLGRNIITQAIEMSEPALSDYFQFVDQSERATDSRFQSCLVLPLNAGNEKIGGLVLFSEQNEFFGETEIKYLSPVSNWLGEKLKSARISRELLSVQNNLESSEQKQADVSQRLSNLAGSFNSNDTITQFCRSLVGAAESKTVHLVGLKNGSLHFYGGSESMNELSENYKTALIEAIDKNKPLIINQEAQGETGRNYITRSTLIFPIPEENRSDAMLFVKHDSIIKLDDQTLKQIDSYCRLALPAIKQMETQRLDITRRKGLEKIISLLSIGKGSDYITNPEFFSKHISGALTENSFALTFSKQTNGSFKIPEDSILFDDTEDNFEIYPGESIIAQAAVEHKAVFMFGRSQVDQTVRSFDDHNRELMIKYFGESGQPDLLATLPIEQSGEILGVVFVGMYQISQSAKSEWQRMLTLAAGLYSLNLTINHTYKSKATDEPTEIPAGGSVGSTLNQLNNHLLAIIGSAELARNKPELSGEMKNHFSNIINEAESAASFVKDSLPKLNWSKSSQSINDGKARVNDIISSLLEKSFISENTYMVGGRPREIYRNLGDTDPIEFSDQSFYNLFEEAINRFASQTDEENAITVSTYFEDGYVYLDISRHHKNFPPVGRVAQIGEYELPDEVLKFRPIDTYLKYLSESESLYSYDRTTSDPSYLSFKFPVKLEGTPLSASTGLPRVLAVDDQEVILELITAMSKNSGFEVRTASSGEIGLELALRESFDIIFTDLAMPGMTGLELAREVKKKKPSLPIVLFTGWEVNMSESELEAAGISKLLYKPFRIEQLEEIINSMVVNKI